MDTDLAPPAVTSPAPPRRRRRGGVQPQAPAYLMVAPFTVLFVAFMVAPLAYALWLSLHVEQRVGGSHFAGLANYVDVLHDSQFGAGLARVGLYAVVEVPVTVLLALVLALALDSGRVRGRVVFQLGFFVPFAIPVVVSSLLWGYMYGKSFGVFTQIAQHVSLPAPDLLGGTWVIPSIANIAVWAGAGATMVILFSALRSIPQELYEAARIDGARELQIVWHIKLPLLRTTMMFSTILALIVALQLFTEPSILAPQARGVITQSFTPNLYAYNLVSTNQEYDYAAAVSFITAVAIVAVTAVFLMVTRRRRSTP